MGGCGSRPELDDTLLKTDAQPKGFLGMTPAELQLNTVRLVSVTAFIAFNIALNFYNSWLLKAPPEKPGFNFPIFYTMWHMLAGAFGVSVIMCFKPPSTGWPSFQQFWEYKYFLVINSACSTISFGLSNVSLTLIALFVNQLIKANQPAMTLVFSAILEKKRYGWPVILSCLLVVGGTILAIPSSSSSTETSAAGVILVIISAAASSLKCVIMAVVMSGSAERPKLATNVVMWYDMLLAFFFMLIYFLASSERSGVMRYDDAGLAVGLILGGATMAFCFNMSNYYFVQSCSALTSAITANGVKVVILVSSAIANHVHDPRNWVGVALTCLAIIAYAYFSFKGRGKPVPPLWPLFPKKEPPPSDPEAPRSMKTESTPLRKP